MLLAGDMRTRFLAAASGRPGPLLPGEGVVVIRFVINLSANGPGSGTTGHNEELAEEARNSP